jgi:hypothetical protein
MLDISPMSQKLTTNSGSLPAHKRAETVMQAVPERFLQTTNMKVIFVCLLMTPVGKDITALFSDQECSPSAWK